MWFNELVMTREYVTFSNQPVKCWTNFGRFIRVTTFFSYTLHIRQIMHTVISGAYCFVVWWPKRPRAFGADTIFWEPCQNRRCLYLLKQCQSSVFRSAYVRDGNRWRCRRWTYVTVNNVPIGDVSAGSGGGVVLGGFEFPRSAGSNLLQNQLWFLG